MMQREISAQAKTPNLTHRQTLLNGHRLPTLFRRKNIARVILGGEDLDPQRLRKGKSFREPNQYCPDSHANFTFARPSRGPRPDSFSTFMRRAVLVKQGISKFLEFPSFFILPLF